MRLAPHTAARAAEVIRCGPPWDASQERSAIAGAFVQAAFGWGVGLCGPPGGARLVGVPRIDRCYPAFFVGRLVVANLLGLYHRYGLPAVRKAGAISLGLAVVGWPTVRKP